MRLLLPILIAASLQAQTGTGRISGFVVDPQGRAVPSANITAVSRSQSTNRNARTSLQGAYAIAGLLPDTYSVTVSAAGFAEVSTTVSVYAGPVTDRKSVV